MTLRQRIEPLIRPFFIAYSRMRRGTTMGVRALVVDGEGRVLLLEHTYIKGWYMPGGGIERGEPAETALRRELMEEAGIEVVGRPTLLSIHDNSRFFPGDHVLLYRVDDWRAGEATQHGEIRRLGWFAPDALPEGISPGTGRRIAEALHGVESDTAW